MFSKWGHFSTISRNCLGLKNGLKFEVRLEFKVRVGSWVVYDIFPTNIEMWGCVLVFVSKKTKCHLSVTSCHMSQRWAVPRYCQWDWCHLQSWRSDRGAPASYTSCPTKTMLCMCMSIFTCRRSSLFVYRLNFLFLFSTSTLCLTSVLHWGNVSQTPTKTTWHVYAGKNERWQWRECTFGCRIIVLDETHWQNWVCLHLSSTRQEFIMTVAT